MLSGAGEWLDENFGFEYPPAASVNNCLQANHSQRRHLPAERRTDVELLEQDHAQPGWR